MCLKMCALRVLVCMAAFGGMAGCGGNNTSTTQEPPKVLKQSFASQVDANHNMTPEQKAMAKQQIQQMPETMGSPVKKP